MKKPVLFIIDMVNDCFIHEPMKKQRAKLCSSINELLEFSRENGFHIIWVRQEFERDLNDAFLVMKEENIHMYIKGTDGPKSLDELVPIAGEHEIVKKRYSMFYKTDLDNLLDEITPSRLILAGVNTHACNRTAAIDAYQRDYRSVIIQDCVFSPDIEHHDVTLEYLGHEIAEVMSLERFKAATVGDENA